jgi:hypothetical protein
MAHRWNEMIFHRVLNNIYRILLNQIGLYVSLRLLKRVLGLQ